MNKEKVSLIVVASIASLIAIGGLSAWCWQFGGQWFSPSTTDWAAFGSFVGGILGPLLSLLTILYMVWSFKKQTASMQKQLEKDREKDERDMLLNEIRFHIEKIEDYYTQLAELPDVADKYLLSFWGEKKKFSIVDQWVIEVDGIPSQGAVFSLLKSLQCKRDVDTVKQFITDNRGSIFLFPLEKSRASLQLVVRLMIEAYEKGLSVNVLRSLVSRCKPIAVSLNDWGELTDWYLDTLSTFELFPVDVRNLPSLVHNSFVLSLNNQEKMKWQLDELNVKIEKKACNYLCFIENKQSRELWKLDYSEVWKKAS